MKTIGRKAALAAMLFAASAGGLSILGAASANASEIVPEPATHLASVEVKICNTNRNQVADEVEVEGTDNYGRDAHWGPSGIAAQSCIQTRNWQWAKGKDVTISYYLGEEQLHWGDKKQVRCQVRKNANSVYTCYIW